MPSGELGKSWDDMTAEERAIFTAHLMHEPDRERLLPERPAMTVEEFKQEWASLERRQQWIDEAEGWIERESIKRAGEQDFKNRSIWSRKP